MAEPLRSAGKTIIGIDDHPVLRRGLISPIESEPDLAVQEAVATCREALVALRESRAGHMGHAAKKRSTTDARQAADPDR